MSLLRLIEPGKHGEIRFDTLPVDVVQPRGDVFAHRQHEPASIAQSQSTL